MNRQAAIWWGAVIGGTVGGFIPDLWHAGVFSLWGVAFATIGGLGGIWLAIRATG